MATHKLILDDLENIDYCLYAIRTELEDYRLAHAINLTLGSRLNRKDFDLRHRLRLRESFSSIRVE